MCVSCAFKFKFVLSVIVPVCHENADLIMNSGGKFVCVCRPGFTGDGVTSCDGQ